MQNLDTNKKNLANTYNELSSMATTGKGTTATDASIEGFKVAIAGAQFVEYKTNLAENALTISADGSLVVSLYYTRLTYTLTYSAPDATGGKMEAENRYYGSAFALADNGFTRTGYAFAGWATEANGAVVYADGAILEMSNADVTLTAKWTANTYTVSFASVTLANSSVNNMPAKSVTMTFDGDVTKKEVGAVPTANGYTFAGWYTSATAGSLLATADGTFVDLASYIVGGKWVRAENVTVYTRFTENKYNVSISSGDGLFTEANGWTIADDDKLTATKENILYTAEIGTLPVAERTGYTFVAYVDDKGEVVLETSTSLSNIDGDLVTLTATWTEKEYVVSLNANGGLCDTASVSVKFDKAFATLALATRTGYTFNGWFTEAENGVQIATADGKVLANVDGYVKGGNYVHAGNITVYAKWTAHTYTVKFDGNKPNTSVTVENIPTDIENVKYDEAISTDAFGKATATGYTFVGWFKDKNGTDEVVYTDKNLTAEDKGSVTLFAHWTAKTYVVSFEPNTPADSSVSGMQTSFSATYDSAFKATLATPTADGYEFAGWFTEAENGGQIATADGKVLKNVDGYVADGNYVHAGNITVYAKWIANEYTITFTKNNDKATGADYTQDATYAKEFTLADCTFTYAGYNFMGWATTASGEVQYQSGTEVKNLTKTKAITLYAVWEAKTLTITLDATANGGTCETATITAVFDSVYSNLKGVEATRTGWDFAGWFDAKVDGNQITATTPVTNPENHTLYAHFTINKYQVNISVDPEGKGTTTGAKGYDYNEKVTVTATASDGYHFVKWTENGNEKSKDVEYIFNMPANDVILVAHFEIDTYTVKISKIGATAGGTIGIGELASPEVLTKSGVEFNSTIDLYQKANTGYTFAGWFSDADGNTSLGVTDKNGVATYTVPAQKANGATINLYAKFTENAYNIIFKENVPKNASTTCKGITPGMTLIAYTASVNLEKNNFTLEGYTFTGWNTKADGKGASYVDRQSVSKLSAVNEADVELYAQWSANKYTVSFESEKLTDATVGSMPANIPVTFDSAFVTSISVPVATGYTFTGWFTSTGVAVTNGEGTVNESVAGFITAGKWTLADNATFKARWQANGYTIKFVGKAPATTSNVVKGTMADIPATFATEVTLPANGYTLEGYTFAGWLYNENTYTNGATVKNLTTELDKVVELVSQWTANKYTITFDANVPETATTTVSGSTANLSMTYDQAKALTENGFVLEGYTFAGWTFGENTYANGATVNNLSATNGATVTLKATWTQNDIKVTFNIGAHGSTDTTEKTVKFNGTYGTLPAVTPASGYSFEGWFTEDGTAISETTKVIISTDHTLVARYTASDETKYTIRYEMQDISADGKSLVDGKYTEFDSQVEIGTTDDPANATAVSKYFTNGVFDKTKLPGRTFVEEGSKLTGTIVGEGSLVLVVRFTRDTFDVALDKGTGISAVTGNATYYYGATVQLGATVKAGYTWKNWTGGLDLDAQDATFVLEAKAIALTANATANEYTVTLNAQENGGTPATQTLTVTFDANYTGIDAIKATKTGWIFDGWYTLATGGTKVTDATKVTKPNNHTLYAHFTINDYELILKVLPDEAYGKTTGAGTYNYNKTVAITATANAGYHFVEWQTEAGERVSTSASYEVTIPVNGLTLVARFAKDTYTIKVVKAGATAGGNAGIGEVGTTTTTAEFGSTITLVQNTETGYTFGGFTVETGSVDTDGKYTVPAQTANGATITITATWSENSYTITFDGAKPEGATGTVTGKTEQMTLSFTASKALSANGFVLPGYRFTGWAETKNGAVKYADGATVSGLSSDKDGKVTLYAVWTALTYQVTFNGNAQADSSVAGVPTAKTVTFDGAFGSTIVPVTSTGYTFKGWFTEKENGIMVADATGAVQSNVEGYITAGKWTRVGGTTFFAQWTANKYTVSISANNGTFTAANGWTLNEAKTIATKQVAFAQTLGTLPVAERTGYTFGSYVMGETTITTASKNLASAEGATVSVKATWDANTYTITLNANGGNPLTQTATATYDVALSLTDTVASRVGYDFVGWFTSATAGLAITDNTGKVNATVEGYLVDGKWAHDGNATFYAHWEAHTYSVSFNGNTPAGSDVKDIPSTISGIKYDAQISANALGIPSAPGYKFEGWYTEGGKLVVNTDKNLTSVDGETVVLIARWSEKSDTAYKIETYVKNLTDASTLATTYEKLETENKTGTTNATVNATAISKNFTNGELNLAGYILETDASELKATINPNGTTVLKVYLTREKYTVTLNKETGISAVSGNGEFYFGATINIDATVSAGYTWNGWTGDKTLATKETSFVLGAGNVTLTATATANKYTVTFDANGGNCSTKTMTVTYAETYGTLPEATRTGYTFNGWFTDKTAGTQVEADTPVTITTAQTLYAHWDINQYNLTITVSPADTGTTEGAGTYDYNTAITVKATASAGYHFVRWTDAEGEKSTKAEYKFNMPAGDYALTAVFDKNVYTVKVSAIGTGTAGATIGIGASGTTSATANYLDNVNLYATASNGYTFNGWFVDANGATALTVKAGTGYNIYQVTNTIANNGTINLYAKFTANVYTVKFNANGATVASAIADMTATFGGSIAIPTVTNKYSKTGYTFIGWNTDSAATKEIAALVGTIDVSTLVREVGLETPYAPATITLYAIWKANTYIVNYVTAGGTSITSVTATYNEAYAFGTTSRVGYTFAGFTATGLNTATAKYGDGTTWTAWSNGTTAVTADKFMNLASEQGAIVVLTAKWNANTNTKYTVKHFTENLDGTWEEADSVKHTGTTASTVDLASVKTTYEGFTYSRYTTNLTENALTISADGNLVISLYYTRNSYSVRFNANKPAGTAGSVSGLNANINGVKYGAALASSELATPSLVGYTFAGYNTQANGKGTVVTYESTSLTAENGAIVDVYATWTAKQYKVIFNGNAPAGVSTVGNIPTTITATYDEDISANELGKATATGYTFQSWNTKKGGTGDEVLATSRNLSTGADVTIYAQWTANKYAVTLYTYVKVGDGEATESAVGGTVTGAGSIDFNATATIKATELAGYHFVGWYTGKGVSTQFATTATATTDKMTTSGLVYTALFEANTYTVIFDAVDGLIGESKTVSSVLVYSREYAGFAALHPGLTPKKAGYDFDYFTKADGSTVLASATLKNLTTENGGTVTLSAHYTIHSNYTLEVEAVNGTASITKVNGTALTTAVSSKDGIIYGTATTVTATKVKGYHFDGWYVSSVATANKIAGAGETYNFNMPALTKNNETYKLIASYVADEYTLSISVVTRVNGKADTNVGGTVTGAGKYKFGTSATVSATANTGYTFAGWFTNANCTTSATVTSGKYAIPAQDKNGATITIYALFTANGYNVTFNANGGIPETGSKTVYYNSTYGTLNTVTRSGYYFTSWNTAKDGSGETVTATTKVTITADQTLYAQWRENTYRITFDGITGTTTKTYTESFTTNSGADINTANAGYHIVGWSLTKATAGSGSAIYGLNATVTVTDLATKAGKLAGNTAGYDITLYPIYSANTYTIEYASNYPTFAGAQTNTTQTQTGITYSASGKVTLKGAIFTYTGATLKGWRLDDAKTYALSASVDVATILEDAGLLNTNGGKVTLSAIWEQNKYALTITNKFVGADNKLTVGTDGGSVSGAGSYYYTQSTTLTISPATGYKFVGFFTDADCTSAYTTGLTKVSDTEYTFKMPASKATIYAKFAIQTYTLTIKNYTQYGSETATLSDAGFASLGGLTFTGSAGTYTAQVTFGQTASITATAKSGYTFAGWFTGTGTSGTKTTGTLKTAAMTTAGLTYTALYTANSYTLTLKAYVKVGTDGTPTESALGGSVSGAGSVILTKTATITASVNDGYSFVGWFVGTDFTKTATSKELSMTTAAMTTAGQTYSALFETKAYTVTVSAGVGGTARIGTTGSTLNATFNVVDSDLNAQKVTVSATENEGYTFEGWYNVKGSTETKISGAGRQYTFTMPADNVTLKSKFTINQYDLTVKVQTRFGNTIEASGDGVLGGTVKIGSGTAGTSVTAGIDYNATTTITATANSGYTFVGWYKGVVSGNPIATTATMTTTAMTTAGQNYFALFESKTYDINIYSYAITGSSIALKAMGISIKSDYVTTSGIVTTIKMPLKKTATMTAPTVTGYTFTKWVAGRGTTGTEVASSNGVATTQAQASIPTSALEYSAVYTANSYTVTISKGTGVKSVSYSTNLNGTTGSEKTFTVYFGETVTLTGTVSTGYYNIAYSATGVTISSGSYTHNIASDLTITVSATIKTFGVTTSATPTAGGNAYVGATGTGASANYNYGASVTVRAIATTGYHFTGWYVGETKVSDDLTHTFTMQDIGANGSKYNLVAHFAQNTYNVEVGSATYGYNETDAKHELSSTLVGGTVSGNATGVVYGKTATVNATASAGYAFIGWFENANCTGSAVSTSASYSPTLNNSLTYVSNGTNQGTYRLYAKFQENTYKFAYKNGTTALATSGVKAFTGSYTVNNGVTKTGYTLAGWNITHATTKAVTLVTNNKAYTVNDLATYAGVTAGSASTITIELVAKWTANTYTVTFNPNGGTVVGDKTKEVTYNANYGTLPTATLAGYEFASWNTAKDGTGTTISASTKVQITGAQTLYAQYTIHEYTLSVGVTTENGKALGSAYITNAKGSAITGTSTTTLTDVQYNSSVTVKAVASVAGYHFTGWTSTVSGIASDSAEYTFTMPAMAKGATLTLTANFAVDEYTVTLVSKTFSNGSSSTFVGGRVGFGAITNETSPSQTLKFGASAELYARANAGYSFVGWFTNEACTTSAGVTTSAVQSDYKGTYTATAHSNGASYKLYAKFEANKVAYTVEHYDEKVDGTYPTTASRTTTGLTAFTDSTVTATNTPLTGFSVDTTKTGTSNTGRVAGDGSTVLKVYYKRNSYTLTLKKGTGIDTVTGAGSYKYGASVTINATMLAGYDWSKWTNGSSGSLTPELTTFAPRRSKLTNSSSDFSTTKNCTFTMPANDLTLTANATAHTYTVTLNKVGGTGGTDTISATYNTTISAITAPSKTGNTFLGYFTEEGGKGTKYFNANGSVNKDAVTTWTITSNITLYANWSVNGYTVTVSGIEADGGSVTGAGTYNYGSTVTITATANTGWSFGGWFTNNTLTTAASNSTVGGTVYKPTDTTYKFTMPAGNVSYFAKFTINAYEVSVTTKYQSAKDATTLNAVATGETGGTVAISGTTATINGKTCYIYNSVVTLTATAKTGYTFAGWFNASGTQVYNDTTKKLATVYTFNMGAENATYTAKFVANKVQVSVGAEYKKATSATVLPTTYTAGTTGGTISLAKVLANATVGDTTTATSVTGGYVFYGTTTSVTNAPATGFVFETYAIGSTTFTSGTTSAIRSATTITARFASKQYTITATAYFKNVGGSITAGTTGGTVSGTSKIYHGFGTEFTASAATGYTFKGWYTAVPTDSATASETAVKYTIASVTANATVYAYFTQNQYTVTVSAETATAKDASSLNTYTTSTDGGNAYIGATGTALSATFTHGLKATLRAVAKDGYSFIAWYNAGGTNIATTATAEVTVTASTSYSARFQANKYTLTLVARFASAKDATTLNAIANDTDATAYSAFAGGGSFYPGKAVTLTATAKSGYVFKGWFTNAACSSAATVSGTSYSGLVIGGTTLYGYFEQARYQVTVGTFGTGTGSVKIAKVLTSATGTATSSNATTGYIFHGKVAELTATVGTGSNFNGWFTSTTEATAESTNASYSPTISASKTFYAKFTLMSLGVSLEQRYQVASSATALDSTLGSGTAGGALTGAGAYNYGATVKVKATANSGYTFVGWFDNAACTGTAKSTTAEYSFTMGTSSVSLYAYFTLNKYTLSLTAQFKKATSATEIPSAYTTGTTGGTVSGGGSYYPGKAVTLTATPATGFSFVGWYNASGTSLSTSTSYSFSGLAVGGTTVYARFESTRMSLSYIMLARTANSVNTVTSGDNGSNCGTVKISVAPIYYGFATTFTATPTDNYIFRGWYSMSDTSTCLSTDATYEISSVTENLTLIAMFEQKAYKVSVVVRGITSTASTTLTTGVGGTASVTTTQYSVNGNTGYFAGYEVTLSATASTGYTFDAFYTTSACTSSTKLSGNKYTTVNANSTVYAKFIINSYIINATARYQSAINAVGLGPLTTGTTGGTVSGGGSYDYNASVTLKATAKTGYRFVGWFNNEECTGTASSTSASFTFKVSGNATYYAKFVQSQVIVSVLTKYRTASGINTLGDLTVGTTGGTISATSDSTIYYGQSITFTADPASGYTFVGWFNSSNASVGTDTTYTASEVKANIFGIYAKFVKTPLTGVSAHVGTVKGGTAKVDTAKYSGEVTGWFAGYNMTISASATTGYTFKGWYNTEACSGTAVSTSASYTFKLSADTNKAYYALFELNSYSVSVVTQFKTATSSNTLPASYSTGTAGGTVSGTGTFTHGTKVTLTASAKTGYTFVGWFPSVSETSASGTGTTYTISSLTGATTMYARFEQTNYTVTIKAFYQSPASATTLGSLTLGTTGGTLSGSFALSNSNGTYTVSVYHGVSITFTATPATNYQIAGWYSTGDCTGSSLGTSATLARTISGTSTFSVKFVAKAYALSLAVRYRSATSATALGDIATDTTGIAGTVTGAGSYYVSKTVSLTATAKTGYVFVGWYSDSACSSLLATGSTTSSYTYTTGASAKTIYAYFEQAKYLVTLTSRYQAATSATALGTLTTGETGGYARIASALNASGTVVTSVASGYIYHGQNATISATAKTSVTISSVSRNFTFAGWFSNEACTTSTTGGSRTITGNTTLYAKFVNATFTINASAYFKNATSATTLGSLTSGTDGGTATGGTFYHGFTGTATASAKTNYKLVGWYSNTACTSTASASVAGTAGSTTNRYALFEPDTYNVTWHPNGGAWQSASGSFIYRAQPEISTSNYKTISYYKTWTGTIAFPTEPTRTGYGYVFAGWFTASTGGTQVTTATVYSLNGGTVDKSFYAHWLKEITVSDYYRTPQAMHAGTSATASFGSSRTSAQASEGGSITLTATSRTPNYIFVGWYSTAEYTGTALSTSTEYTLTNANITAGMTVYAIYKPDSKQATVKTYTLGGASVYSNTATGLTGTVVKIGSETVTTISALSGTFTAYYGGSYVLTTTASTYYEVKGFIAGSTTTPTESSSLTKAGSSYTVSAYSTTNIQTLIRGVELTITYNANGLTGVTMPTSVKARYGTTVSGTYGFNAYADTAETYKHTGWSATASGSVAYTRTDANYKSTATYSFTLSTSIATVNKTAKTATIYASKSTPAIWVKYSNASGVLALDSAPRGAASFTAVKTTISGLSGLTAVNAVLKANLTLGGDFSATSISGSFTLTGSGKTLTFASGNRFFTATTTNIHTITLTGDVCFKVASGKTLNIGNSSATSNTTVISSAAPSATSNETKSIFVVNGGTLNIHRTSITNYTVGASGGNGGIVYATNSAKVTTSYLTVSGGTANGNSLFYINSSTMGMTNCNITVATASSSFNGIFYNEKSSLTLTGGSINANGQRVVYEVGDTTSATTTISGTTIVGSAS